MTNLISQSQIKTAPAMWMGVNCLLALIEGVVIYSQLHHPGAQLWSFHFFYLPVVLTVPYSVISPLYLKARSERLGPDLDAQRSLSYVAAFSLLVAYITLFISLAEFL
jgi:hypothetical protein